MIPENEFRQLARTTGVPISTIERDYAQNWLLAHLPEMAFKGGTGLRKVYLENYRFSDDLDFTLVKNIKIDRLRDQIHISITRARSSVWINFLDDIKLDEVKNGYVITIYFRILRTTGDPLKIKLDLTKKKNEIIVEPLQRKGLIHNYSDELQKRVLVYSIDEIFAEKVRALFERTRPRDLYDVWHLNESHVLDRSILKKKCDFKHVELDLEDLKSRRSRFVNAWGRSLIHQMKDLPPADKVFESVIKNLKGYF